MIAPNFEGVVHSGVLDNISEQMVLDNDISWWEVATYLDMFYICLGTGKLMLPILELCQMVAILNSKMAAMIMLFSSMNTIIAHFKNNIKILSHNMSEHE